MSWGVARPLVLPTIVKTVGDADVTCTAGSDITGFTPSAALIAGYAGSFAYLVWIHATVVMGGTASASLAVKLKTATPTTLDTWTVPPANLVNSAIVPLAICLVGTASASLYFPTGDIPIITFTAGTTACTLKAGSRAVFSLIQVGE